MVYGSVLRGFKGLPVAVEVDLKRGIPHTVVSGLPRGALVESVDRIRASIRNAGFQYPMERVLINLSPAGIIKSGTSFDLALACAILRATGIIATDDRKILALGELTLSGKILRVEGILNAIISLKEMMDLILIPPDTVKTQFFDDNRIVETPDLNTAISIINNRRNEILKNHTPADLSYQNFGQESFEKIYPVDHTFFSRCKLQPEMIGAALIAATSGQHCFFYGPPGTGKSYCADLVSVLLPKNNIDLAGEVSGIHSAVGIYGKNGLITQPPCRKPHHSASVEGMVGGGKKLMPGEITLAHGGVIILDEAPEFKPSILQALREPLETGTISIIRAGEKWHYPANFQAILTANLCPCGQYGRSGAVCLCTPRDMVRYWNRMGGALFDRIAIRLPFFESSTEKKSSSFESLTFDFLNLQKKVYNARLMLSSIFKDPLLRNIKSDKIFNFVKKHTNNFEEIDNLSFRQRVDLFRIAISSMVLREGRTIDFGDFKIATELINGASSPMDCRSIESKDFFIRLLGN